MTSLIRKRAFSGLAPVAVLFTMLLPWPAHAQDPTPVPAAEKKADPAPSPARRGGRRIDLTEEFLVEGKLEKPNAFILFRRSQMDYDWARLDARFTPLVLESVQDPLF
jgi:hypothetical protein